MIQLSGMDFDQNFNLLKQGFFIVYFKQNSCPNCKLFDPIFIQLEQEKNKNGLSFVDFAVVNVTVGIMNNAKNVDIDIDKVPTILVFNNTIKPAIITTYYGPLTKIDLLQFLKNTTDNVKYQTNRLQPQPQQPINTQRHNQQNIYNSQYNNQYASGGVQPPAFISALKNKNGMEYDASPYADVDYSLLEWGNEFFRPKDKPWISDYKKI